MACRPSQVLECFGLPCDASKMKTSTEYRYTTFNTILSQFTFDGFVTPDIASQTALPMRDWMIMGAKMNHLLRQHGQPVPSLVALITGGAKSMEDLLTALIAIKRDQTRDRVECSSLVAQLREAKKLQAQALEDLEAKQEELDDKMETAKMIEILKKSENVDY